MNTTRFRSKRVLIPTTVAVAALAVGGVVWASTANAELEGSERDRVAAAATRAAGGGEVVSAESSDDRGEAYEVEVRQEDGTEVDVALDENLDVVGKDADDDAGDPTDDATDTPDADDRALSAAETGAAEKAALAAVPDATDAHAEASDDPGEAYEVDVRTRDLTEWNVTLDADFKVLSKAVDN